MRCEGLCNALEVQGSGLTSALPALRFREEDYTVHVQLNDYLDIICPHYEDDSVADAAMERYTLYMVEHQEYVACEPQSKDQVRWKCNQPSAKHGPEKLSEKFQRFTPFTLGKEFKEGHSYYYICECTRDRPQSTDRRMLSGASSSREPSPSESNSDFLPFVSGMWNKLQVS